MGSGKNNHLDTKICASQIEHLDSQLPPHPVLLCRKCDILIPLTYALSCRKRNNNTTNTTTTELSSQCISCQAVKMPNLHITTPLLLLPFLRSESICQKFSVKLKYGKENSRNDYERGFPAGE